MLSRSRGRIPSQGSAEPLRLIYISSPPWKSLQPNMAGNRDRVYWNDSKTTVRKKLGLQDNEDFSKFEVGLLLTLSLYRIGLRLPVRTYVPMLIDSSFP